MGDSPGHQSRLCKRARLSRPAHVFGLNRNPDWPSHALGFLLRGPTSRHQPDRASPTSRSNVASRSRPAPASDWNGNDSQPEPASSVSTCPDVTGSWHLDPGKNRRRRHCKSTRFAPCRSMRGCEQYWDPLECLVPNTPSFCAKGRRPSPGQA